MFILRVLFWLVIVVMILPMDETSTSNNEAGAVRQMSVGGAVSAASATVSDMASFCERNSQACDTGAAAFDLFLRKLENGARLAYRVAAGQDTLSSAPAPALRDTHGGQTDLAPRDTLRGEDLVPSWRGPQDGDA